MSRAVLPVSTDAPTPAGAFAAAQSSALPAEVDRLLAAIAARFPAGDIESVRRAYLTAEAAHAGQRRASGEPYISHPLAVAQILASLGLDPPTVAAALLHDVVEDTAVDQQTLTEVFGPEVARLVAGVTKITAIETREKAEAEAESLRRMFLAAGDDLRVILIKLADRRHNMETLDALEPERRRHLAKETLEIYAPVANRLGLWQLKSELEDLALCQLQPEAYESIRVALASRRAEHETYLANVIDVLDKRLRAAGIQAQISSRGKHFYSIYRKMQRKGVGPNQIYDVLAVRVLVDSQEQCYVALGLVHTMWPPVGGQFDDYIAKPKNNLYQSLHTSVLGPGNRPLEVQIRTREMHEMAERGMAAHWLYKEDTAQAREIEEQITALRHLLASHNEDASDAQAYVDGLKTDVFHDQVYVLTPQGDVIELPTGSTPVDFAYHIHTEVGHRCRGAMVDGKMVSLDTPLATGQTVKIITTKADAGPSRDWLNPTLGYAASTRAREKVRQWFRRQARGAAIRDGREVLERQLRKLGLTRVKHGEVARLFGFDRLADFLAAVGRSDVPAEAIGTRLLEAEGQPGEDTDGPVPAYPRAGPAPRPASGPPSGVKLHGADGMFTRIGQCCRPIPGDQIVGYITRGRGVTLHRDDCHNIRALRARELERFIRVDWQHSDRQTYSVELRVSAYDRSGLVRDISDVVAQRGVNMISIQAAADPANGTAIVTTVVQILSHNDLTRLIDKLGTVENVIEVHRATG